MVNNILGVVLIVTIFVALFLVVYFLYKRNFNRPLDESNKRKFSIVTQYLIVFLIFLTISITVFLKVNNQKIENVSSISPNKGSTYEFDETCIAFRHGISHMDLLISNVISEEDELKLNDLQNKY